MAIVYSYPQNDGILSSDILVGTSTKLYAGKPINETKNFNVLDLGVFITGLGINNLDTVLHNGNTSLLDANVGRIGLFDQVNLATMYISANNNIYTLKTVNANNTISAQQGLLSVYKTNSVSGSLSTSLLNSSRTYQLPDASGTIALTSDIPVITTPNLDEVLAEGDTGTGKNITLTLEGDAIFSYGGVLSTFDNTTGNVGNTIQVQPYAVIISDNIGQLQLSKSSISQGDGMFSTSLIWDTLLSNEVITIPNATGIIALTSDLTGFVTSVSATSPITSSGGNTPTISTSMSTNKLIGRSTAGTGVMEEITIGTGLTLSGGILNGSSSGVTSVGLTMPSAFTVTNSPITSSGDIAVTGAGTVSQYVRGDGTLANFPNSTGGGASVNYYLNGSVSQGTFGGTTYYQMSKTPILGTGTNFIRTNGAGNGYIASFITDAGDPSFLNIPGGNWNLEFYFQSSASGGSPQFYGEIYKVSATNVFTLIASGSANPEGITNGTTVDQYFTSIPVPQTSLLITDRLAIRIYVITGGRTITLHTENGNLCEVLTTFTTGLTALNGLTSQVQYFAVGTSGTDFNISSATDTHTFNLPTASATNRGALSSTDWTTFNAKQNALLDIASVQDNGIYSTFMNGAICYFLAGIGATTFSNLRINSNFVLAGSSAYWSNNAIQFTSSATAGTFAFQRGVPFYHAGKSLMRFQPNIVSTGARYFVGLSYLYQLSNPTNVEPTTLTQTIGVAKLSTSTNLFIIHNDGTGTATSVDLGVNYPATSNLYIYDIKITSTGSVFTGVTVRRTTISDNTYITYNYSVPGDYPTGVGINPALWITNNATAAANSLYHFGAIGYNNTI